MSAADSPRAEAAGVVTKPSPLPVVEMVDRLVQLIEDRGLKVFTVVDHSGEAAAAGLTMPDTRVVIFGSPAAGTPVMLAAPLAALDLPLKVLVWADDEGGQWVSYNDPAYLAARYSLDEALASRLSGVVALVDAALAL